MIELPKIKKLWQVAPSRERGLKLEQMKKDDPSACRSFAGAWIEIFSKHRLHIATGVCRSFAGAWIEIQD